MIQAAALALPMLARVGGMVAGRAAAAGAAESAAGAGAATAGRMASFRTGAAIGNMASQMGGGQQTRQMNDNAVSNEQQATGGEFIPY